MSIRLLEHLRDELIQTGIVTNTPEFCRSWLGRSEGYIRVLRYNRIDPSVETLTICSNKLGYYAARLNGSDAEEHKAWAAKLINLKALCDSAIARQAEAVWRAALNGWRYEHLSELGSTAAKICAAVFCGPVLIIPRWSFAGPKDAG
jgi:hypothetical protein